ncbi:hypothetical protein EMCRGX_G010398 [Ephydatia muelleri]
MHHWGFQALSFWHSPLPLLQCPSTQYSFVEAACTTAGCQTGGVANVTTLDTPVGQAPPPLNTNSSSMSLQWNASLQPDYVITAYTLPHRVPSLKSQSEMWVPPSTATVQFHTYNPSGILFYQINSVMTDILEYQNLQRWSVAHCELQNSSVILSLYVGASVVQFPACNLCDGQGYVVLFEQASNTFYVTVDTVHAAAITAHVEQIWHCNPLQHVSYPLLNAPDQFDAVSVQNVGSTYIIASWDLPTHSNGILINFSLYCIGALAGVLPLTVISYNNTGLLPFTLYMYMSSSHARRHCTPVGMWCWALSVLQPACPVMYMYTSRDICGKLHIPFIPPCTDLYCCLCQPWGLTATTKPTRAVQDTLTWIFCEGRPYGGAYSRSPIPQLEQDVGMGHLFSPPQTGNPGSITEIECTLLSGSAEQDALTMKESPLKKLDTVLPKAPPIVGVVAND